MNCKDAKQQVLRAISAGTFDPAEGCRWPRDVIAAYAGVCEKTVSRATAELELEGRLRVHRPRKRGECNTYFVAVWNPPLRKRTIARLRETKPVVSRLRQAKCPPKRKAKPCGSPQTPQAQQAYIPSTALVERASERKTMQFPRELLERRQWVNWRYEMRAGRRTKLPTRPTAPNRMASSTDPSTWGTFDRAAMVLAEGAAPGVGFVFSPDDPFAGVDFDACVTERRIHPAVASLVRVLDSYAEFSPSGKGLHVIVEAELVGDRKRTGKTPWGGEFENYDRGRFFCMTGDRVPDSPLEVARRQSQLNAVRKGLFPRPKKLPPRRPGPPIADDETLIRRAFAARNGGRFEALWRGDWRSLGYSSQSEADLALVGRLAFWTNGDRERIDRLFRQSGLMRPKWDVYGHRVIAKAVDG